MTAPSPQAREALTEALANALHKPYCQSVNTNPSCLGPAERDWNSAEAVVTYLTSPEGTAHVLALLNPIGWGDTEADRWMAAVLQSGRNGGYQQAKDQAARKLRRYADEHEHEGTYDGICKAADLVDRMRP